MTTTTTEHDYNALWTRAAGEHSAANDRLQKAREEAEAATLREVIYAAMSHGIVVLQLGSSDQGSFMCVEKVIDANGEIDADDWGDELQDDLWAVSDLDDHYEADWANNEGITADWLRSGSIVVINVPLAARALARKDAGLCVSCGIKHSEEH